MYTEKVLVKLTKLQKDLLKHYANDLQVNLSQLIRMSINHYLNTKTQQNEHKQG
jgi:hypothetical protein